MVKYTYKPWNKYLHIVFFFSKILFAVARSRRYPWGCCLKICIKKSKTVQKKKKIAELLLTTFPFCSTQWENVYYIALSSTIINLQFEKHHSMACLNAYFADKNIFRLVFVHFKFSFQNKCLCLNSVLLFIVLLIFFILNPPQCISFECISPLARE